MKAFKLFCLLSLLGLFLFNSCFEQSFITLESASDEILHPIVIDIPVTVSKGVSKDTCRGWIDLDIKDALFFDLRGFLVDLRDFTVKQVTIQVSEGTTEGIIENLRLTVGSSNFTIPIYSIGNIYDGNDRKLIDLLQSVFNQVLPPVSATQKLEVRGETDIDVDIPLNYILTIDYAITIPAP